MNKKQKKKRLSIIYGALLAISGFTTYIIGIQTNIILSMGNIFVNSPEANWGSTLVFVMIFALPAWAIIHGIITINKNLK